MNKKIFFIVCLIAIIRIIYVLVNNNYEEVNKNITGKITNIIVKDNKTVIDINRKYRITIYKKVNYNLGDKIKVKGSLEPLSNNTIPNLFNYKKYMLSKNIKLSSNKAKITLLKKNTNVFYGIKNLIIKRISNYKTSKYLNAFILGDSSYINDDIKEAYRNIGISHLFAISGMHVSIFLLLINKIFKKYKYKNLIIFLFLLFFLFLTNFSESLLRCVCFIYLSWFNKKISLGFKNDKLLLLEALILISINPYFIYNIGFLFSVTITFFIIISSKLFNQKSYIIKTFIMSIICFLASIPILVLSFFKINIMAIIYNVIFIPVISFIYFPFSLITFIFPVFDEIYFFMLNALEYLILMFNNVKLLTFVVSKPNFLVIIMYYVFLYLFIKIDKKYIIIFIIILIININSRFLIFNTEIAFLDVGQGDSVVLIFPKGKTILIDTGGIYKNEGKIAKNKTIPYLNSKGINKIDLLILTHGDYDHIGDSINLVENFRVEKVIFNCGEFNDLEQELIKVLTNKKIPYYSCIKELNINSNKLYFLNNKLYGNENNNSSVIYTELNNHKFLFMGDAEVEVEQDLLKKYNLQDIDVLKVGHHGSKTSSSKEFIDKINPKYSVISVGKNNRYGHPNNEVLNVLEDTKIYRTDLDGSVIFKMKSNKLKIETCIP